MHPWVIWHLAEERVEELHGHRHRYSDRYRYSDRHQPRVHLNGTGERSPRRPDRIHLADRLAGWAGRHMIAIGARLARRGRPARRVTPAGVGNQALGATR